MSRLILSLIVSLLVANSSMAQDASNATVRLTKQSEQFQEQVIKVADNVYAAVGFSVSNVSMVVGDDGVVIVDTGMMLDDASRIATEFRKLSDKPVKAIIFTHAHGDHTGGAAAFLGNPSNLFRLSPKSEAERLAKLAGGQDKLLAAAKAAVAADDNQWAAQLADHLLAMNKDNSEAKQVKINALTNLASNMVNATARNYYLTVARELREELRTK